MKDISTEELRKRMANYSPASETDKQRQEQEQRNAALTKDIATLSELSHKIEADANRLTALAAELRTTHFAVTLPDEVKVALRQCCEDAANTAAETFKAQTRPLLKEMAKGNTVSRSLPAPPIPYSSSSFGWSYSSPLYSTPIASCGSPQTCGKSFGLRLLA